jgi:Fe-S-cluster containining protein
MLDSASSRCLIYENRPFGCAHHFCREAGGPYSRKEVLDLIHRLEEIDKRLGGDGPHPIEEAISDALRACQ